MDIVMLPSLLTGLAVFLVFAGTTLILRHRSFEIDTRMNRLPKLDIVNPGVSGGGKSVRRAMPGFLTRGASGGLAAQLAQADLQIAPGEFVLINIATLILGTVLGYFIWHSSLALAALGAVIGAFAPRTYLNWLRAQRLKAFDARLADTIVLIANSMRSGYSLLQSLDTVASEMRPPISSEFSRVAREVALGLSLPEALGNLLRRVPSDDLDLMITAIAINHEVGGNLAEILDTIAFTIRERVRILGEVRAITAQQRLSALLLSLLPLGLALVIYALNPGYIGELWKSMCGWSMLGTGIIMMIAGFIIIRRIAAIQV